MSESPQTMAPLEQIGENLVKLTLSIEPSRFEEGLHHAYLKNRNQITMPGFRKGRAPRKMIEAQYGKEFFYEDALDFVFPQAYEAAIKQHNLEVVSAPQVDIEEKDGGVLIFVEVYTKPQVEIEDYTGITYKEPQREATDEEVDAEIDKDKEKNARIITITDRRAESGDLVIIDFEGFVDDVPFPGGKGENFELALGSKSFIDTFEEQIVGKNTGDNFDVNVTFPKEYHAPELAGKPAVFKVKLHEIKHKELPAADDDFAQEVSEFDTLAEYKDSIKQKISKQKSDAAEIDIENQIIKALSEKITVNIPKPMVEAEVNRMLRDFASRVQSQGMDFSRYLQMMGMDVANLRMMYQEQASNSVLSRLAIEAVVKKEAIDVSEDEYNKEIDRLAELYSIEKEKLLESIGPDEADALKDDLKAKKAVDLVKAAAIAE